MWSPFGSPKYKVPYYTKDPKIGTIILTTIHMLFLVLLCPAGKNIATACKLRGKILR